MSTVAILGVGAMGEAIARGLRASGSIEAGDLTLYSPSVERIEKLSEEIGAKAAQTALECVQGADTILLAVKPHMIASVLEPLKDAITPAQTLVSVAAGTNAATIEACFDQEIPVVRAMPNTPSLVRQGATAICAGKYATRADLDKANAIFSAIGLCVEVEEKQIDAVTGLSGSGPAYVFLFIEALADGGVRAGLKRDVALQLAAQTVLGGAQMVLETGEHPGALKDKVTSPGGTTIAAIHALENGAFRGTVMDAVMASYNRAREMS